MLFCGRAHFASGGHSMARIPAGKMKASLSLPWVEAQNSACDHREHRPKAGIRVTK